MFLTLSLKFTNCLSKIPIKSRKSVNNTSILVVTNLFHFNRVMLTSKQYKTISYNLYLKRSKV